MFYSASDYICKFCDAELANTYYICVGCKQLLGKNLLICQDCYEGEKYHNRVRMHSVNNKWFSDANHIPIKLNRLTRAECHCKQGNCRACGYCKFCSCQCHLHFQRNQRFFTATQLERDLNRIRRLVGVPEPDDEDDPTLIQCLSSVPEPGDGARSTTCKGCVSLFVEDLCDVPNKEDVYK